MQPLKDGGFASDPDSLVKLGCALMTSGRGAQAVALVTGLLAAHPDDAVLREAAAVVLTHKVPLFHGNMLADVARNDAFEAAIVRAAPGRIVLDIGAGSGLLAMMAARAGAARVYACEANEALAATARDIVVANGLADRITIIPKASTALDPQAELGGGVDVVVSEVFSETLIGEGALPTLRDAAARLARPGAVTIPARASIRVALAEHLAMRRPSTGSVSGFDLGLFDRHVRATFNVPVDKRRLELRGEPIDLFAFDLADPPRTDRGRAQSRAQVRAVSSGGAIDAAAQWIHLQLDAHTEYENRPGRGIGSHWPAVVTPLAPRGTRPGDAIAFEAWHDDYQVRIWEA